MNIIRNNLSVICRSSSIDRDTNNISIFNIIEEVTIEQDKIQKVKVGEHTEDAINLPFELFTAWEKLGDVNDSLSSEIKTTILCTNGEEKDYIKFPLEIESGKKKLRLRIQTRGLPFTGYGTYSLRIFVKNGRKFDFVNEIPLEIKPSV